MNDLINRWEAVGAMGNATWAKERLLKLPSAQPEIIRCKDCKYRDDDDFCIGRGYPNMLVPDDGFCDKGERSE